jgi:hypothetical protein
MSSKKKHVIGGTTDSSVGSRRVYVAIARTVALPGYESFRVEYGEGDSVPDGASHDEVRDRILGRVAETVEELVAALKEQLS